VIVRARLVQSSPYILLVREYVCHGHHPEVRSEDLAAILHGRVPLVDALLQREVLALLHFPVAPSRGERRLVVARASDREEAREVSHEILNGPPGTGRNLRGCSLLIDESEDPLLCATVRLCEVHAASFQ
jgi:hypothetical protein